MNGTTKASPNPIDDTPDGCPQVGTLGLHSESYYDDDYDNPTCQWCGLINLKTGDNNEITY